MPKALFISLLGILIPFSAVAEAAENKLPTPPIHEVVRVGFSRGGEPTTLNPTIASNATGITLVWHLYSRLFDLDQGGRLVPMVAETFDHSPDLKTWRFTIRNNVEFFSQETPLKRAIAPKDVKASLEYALSKPGYGRSLLAGLIQGAQDFVDGRTKDIKGIELERQQVLIHLTEPFAFLPERLATSFFSVFPSEYIDQIDKGFVIGSGPYLLKTFDKTTHRIELVHNPIYWDKSKQPVAKRVEVHWFPSEGNLVSEFRAGNLDWVELSAKPTPVVPDGSSETLQLTLNLAVVVFNAQPTKGITKEVRGYLDSVTDRQGLAQHFQGSVPSKGPFPPFILERYGISPPNIVQQTKKHATNKAIELLIMPVEPYKTIGQLLARQWQAAGARVTPVEGGADFWKRLTDGDFQAVLAYFGPLSPGAEQYAWMYLSEMRPMPNAAGYSNERFDHAFQTLITGGVRNTQKAAIQMMLDVALQDVPYMSLFQMSFRVWHPRGLMPRVQANGIMSFETAVK